MLKAIINPGNGINYPNRGDYVRVNLDVFLNNKFNIIFSNKVIIRIDFDSNIIPEIMSLLKEMTLLEKCSLENKSNKTFYEIELLEISNIRIKA